jgi:uncharacterized protein
MSDSKPTVAILGASRDRGKFGNISVRAHHRQGYQVFPINPYADEIEGLAAYATLADLPVESVDRVSVYLLPEQGIELLEEIAELNPGEVWLNPGSVDADLRERARELGLTVIEGCSIVDVGLSPYEV